MIRFQTVSKDYHGKAAVKDLSFVAQKGRITCLIGPSGCGKTTTLKMINRLVEPSSGRILFNGKEHEALDVLQLRRSIGYVIQQVGLFPHMTVQENVCLLESVKKTDRQWRNERCREVLELVGLSPEKFCRRYPHQLSGGQQQRVGIARALMSDPPILLMDEPFGALDPILRSQMHDELIRLNQTLHKTIILVTHDLHEAFKLGDLIILMREGRDIQQGTRQDFLQKPQSGFVQEFVRAQLS